MPRTPRRLSCLASAVVLTLVAAGGIAAVHFAGWLTPTPVGGNPPPRFQPRKPLDPGGLFTLVGSLRPWAPDASLEVIGDRWRRAGYHLIELLDRDLAAPGLDEAGRLGRLITKAIMYNCEGEPDRAYAVLEQARFVAEGSPRLADEWLFSVIYLQGVTALRRGETDNCILCRGESSCILPLSPAAVHTNPLGSRLAIQHLTEYLRQFPDDLEVRWLLNLAHLTLGEHPHQVEPRFLVSLDHFKHSEFDIGRFRDVGALVGVNRFNMSGGAIMDDFDNDDLLDIVVTSWDATEHMALYRNKGDGTFQDRTREAGLTDQFGGLYCVQGDYNNDGHLDIFIVRGAWIPYAIRPSLLRNNGDGTFTDVTEAAGLSGPVNSNSACWADFDNDGFLDLFVCCERQPDRLYRNMGDGTFQEVTARAGLAGQRRFCKGATWIDDDNDGYPDLFLTNYFGPAQLYHNNRDGTFTEVTQTLGIDGPQQGFSCWAWDYDNDGWLDIFATSYDRTLGDVVKGLLGQPHGRGPNKLFRNLQGKGFKDVTREAGLDMVFATMGSNFGDFDNDGYLDMYLGTGEPDLAMLIPNRMFKNVVGQRFAEITAAAGTGHLQKGHAVACGDWDRDGNLDIFIEMGGAIRGDRYHNVLFQNPGQGNNWLTVKLVGMKTNRAAIGARIKVVTAGEKPLTVHRLVSSGSSFGANPLQQTIGVGKAERIAVLEISWPTSGTTQVFRDLAVKQAIEVTEFTHDYRKLDWKRIPLPK
ncbi:MAG TPA: CRTAC1 family protein [Gemmataceae bacterium]